MYRIQIIGFTFCVILYDSLITIYYIHSHLSLSQSLCMNSSEHPCHYHYAWIPPNGTCAIMHDLQNEWWKQTSLSLSFCMNSSKWYMCNNSWQNEWWKQTSLSQSFCMNSSKCYMCNNSLPPKWMMEADILVTIILHEFFQMLHVQ